jgi:hypothetical protein
MRRIRAIAVSSGHEQAAAEPAETEPAEETAG